jgi:cytochrome c553
MRMTPPTLLRPLAQALVLALALGGLAPPALASEPGLVVMMSRLQTYTHKLQLSLAASNAELADFYLHEIEEAAEYVIDHLPLYRDFPVGQLTREMLLPAIETLEDAVDSRDWAQSRIAQAELLQACNACHAATGKGYIRIVPAEGNPFAQDFSVQAD